MGIQDQPSLKKLSPAMINLVENYLKDIQSEDTSSKKSNDSTLVVDLSDDTPTEISVSLWQLGGHVDLMSTLVHFLAKEAIYILSFDLQQNLHDIAIRHEWDFGNQKWVETDSELTNMDTILNWINLIYHKTRLQLVKEEEFDENPGPQPTIIIVGTNRESLHIDPVIQESRVCYYRVLIL